MAKRNPSLRSQVEARAGGRCEYCRSPAKYSTQRFSLEHITPRSRGGRTNLSNLALACQGCNNHKYNREQAPDPFTGEFAPLFNPRGERWEDHFAWDAQFREVIGLTPTGRATVAALQLNREELSFLRRLLYAAGEHPSSEP